MDDALLMFSPKGSAKFNQSPLYGLSMYSKTFFLCCRYFARALKGEANVAVTDEYIKEFWELELQEAHASLYVKGRHLLQPGQVYLFMSNHESWLDIPAMFAAVPGSLRMVSKAGLMQIPVVGPAMERAGFIAVDRKNRPKAIKQLELAKERLLSGISIWMAPEGTRSRDGELLPFKKGGFHLAMSLSLPIVPVFIEGSRDVMPADSLSINTNKAITVHFCEPISTKGLEKSDMAALIEKTRASIVAKKEEAVGQSRSHAHELT